MILTTEELLAGGSLVYDVEVPADLLNLNGSSSQVVKLRPLTVRDLQLIGKAARDDESLSAALMIQQALVEPALKMEQISKLPGGLARFLVQKINAISGISTPQDALEELVQAPLARACFTLSKEFGWTPEEVSGMTIGQILLYLEMARRNGDSP
ncbi:MAG: hypothetical protein LH702_29510 [Phormidesmis sp. CAN_BIN44]|nr:hypothetical protein [Phormidesmis sp. CAN_BIN44]